MILLPDALPSLSEDSAHQLGVLARVDLGVLRHFFELLDPMADCKQQRDGEMKFLTRSQAAILIINLAAQQKYAGETGGGAKVTFCI